MNEHDGFTIAIPAEENERQLKAMFYSQADRPCGVSKPHEGHIYLGHWDDQPGQYWCKGAA